MLPRMVTITMVTMNNKDEMKSRAFGRGPRRRD